MTLHLTHIGRDNWERPVYECNGHLYVDVDPRPSKGPDIFTKQGNAFFGEPLSPIPPNTALEFMPRRDTWGS